MACLPVNLSDSLEKPMLTASLESAESPNDKIYTSVHDNLEVVYSDSFVSTSAMIFSSTSALHLETVYSSSDTFHSEQVSKACDAQHSKTITSNQRSMTDDRTYSDTFIFSSQPSEDGYSDTFLSLSEVSEDDDGTYSETANNVGFMSYSGDTFESLEASHSTTLHEDQLINNIDQDDVAGSYVFSSQSSCSHSSLRRTFPASSETICKDEKWTEYSQSGPGVKKLSAQENIADEARDNFVFHCLKRLQKKQRQQTESKCVHEKILPVPIYHQDFYCKQKMSLLEKKNIIQSPEYSLQERNISHHHNDSSVLSQMIIKPCFIERLKLNNLMETLKQVAEAEIHEPSNCEECRQEQRRLQAAEGQKRFLRWKCNNLKGKQLENRIDRHLVTMDSVNMMAELIRFLPQPGVATEKLLGHLASSHQGGRVQLNNS